jgi:hypothetical protein
MLPVHLDLIQGTANLAAFMLQSNQKAQYVPCTLIFPVQWRLFCVFLIHLAAVNESDTATATHGMAVAVF